MMLGIFSRADLLPVRSLVKYLFKPFIHFLIGMVAFLPLSLTCS